jgi:hypothetical protein
MPLELLKWQARVNRSSYAYGALDPQFAAEPAHPSRHSDQAQPTLGFGSRIRAGNVEAGSGIHDFHFDVVGKQLHRDDDDRRTTVPGRVRHGRTDHPRECMPLRLGHRDSVELRVEPELDPEVGSGFVGELRDQHCQRRSGWIVHLRNGDGSQLRLQGGEARLDIGNPTEERNVLRGPIDLTGDLHPEELDVEANRAERLQRAIVQLETNGRLRLE